VIWPWTEQTGVSQPNPVLSRPTEQPNDRASTSAITGVATIGVVRGSFFAFYFTRAACVPVATVFARSATGATWANVARRVGISFPTPLRKFRAAFLLMPGYRCQRGHPGRELCASCPRAASACFCRRQGFVPSFRAAKPSSTVTRGAIRQLPRGGRRRHRHRGALLQRAGYAQRESACSQLLSLQSLYGSNSLAPAMATPMGRSVWSTRIMSPCFSKTSGSRL
jgi:hypothetical protein